MPFCFLRQNFAEVGQSLDELWPKKRFSRWRPPPSWILKISIFGHVTVIGFNICCNVPHFIKIGWFFTEIWWFSDLLNGGRPPSWIYKKCSFCHVALDDILFCFTIQNFAEIGQSVDELWPKKRLSIAAAAILNLKISIFVHVTVIGFNIWWSIPSFNKIGQFFTEIWRFNDFQNGGRPPSWILIICSFCHAARIDMCSASSYKTLLKSDNRSMNYGQKNDFKYGGRRHLEF